jgi:hypothetical protein
MLLFLQAFLLNSSMCLVLNWSEKPLPPLVILQLFM